MVGAQTNVGTDQGSDDGAEEDPGFGSAVRSGTVFVGRRRRSSATSFIVRQALV